ncbi:hypothetical protein [Amycolatopsis rubida]|uniref:hypothetical protein n=1 Tax=Amycolatopsis rubida TaxID=112413 RepID=UPI00142F3A47|nr:hypothetical protein [Amycolatopsis rubida]
MAAVVAGHAGRAGCVEAGYLTVSHQIWQVGATVEVGKPKSDTSNRVIALDHGTVALLRRHRATQDGDPAGYPFLNGHGRPIRPDALTSLFRVLNTRSGLPPVRCTTCATARPACRSPRARTSRRCSTCSGTAASC